MFPHLLIDSSRNSVMVVNADTMSEAWSMIYSRMDILIT